MAASKPRLGHIRDRHEHVVEDEQERSLGAVLDRKISVHSAHDVTRYIHESPWDQGNTESCVAQAAHRVRQISSTAMGVPCRKGSVLCTYALGRAFDCPVSAGPLTDDGSRPRSIVRAMVEFGTVDEIYWPFDEDAAVVNERPPWDVYSLADGTKVTGWKRLVGNGADRIDQIERVISMDRPLMFGMNVDASYLDYTRGIWDGMKGPTQGGHMQTVVGYDSKSCLIINSWGTTWGMGGYSEIARDFIGGDHCFDFYWLDVAAE